MKTVTMCAAVLMALSASAAVKYTAKYSKTVPIVDGIAENGVWKGAAWSEGFVLRVTGKTPEKATTRFKSVYTDEALYFYVECVEPNVAGIADEHQAHEFWLCDVVELYTTALKNEQVHLVCSARGNLNDEIPGKTCVRTRNHVDWSAKSKIAADRWSCEFRVPFLLLGVSPADGDIAFPINVCRNATTTKELSSWSFQSGSFKSEAGFGTLTLPKAPAEAAEKLRRAADASKLPETAADKEKREHKARIMKRLFTED